MCCLRVLNITQPTNRPAPSLLLPLATGHWEARTQARRNLQCISNSHARNERGTTPPRTRAASSHPGRRQAWSRRSAAPAPSWLAPLLYYQLSMPQKRLREEPGASATDGLTVLHRSRLAPWRVAAVTCIAACPDGSVFAAGYDDGKVEVFDAGLFNCLARIPGSDGSEVSSVAWARADGDSHWRLFAATLDGSLHELCCRRLAPVASTDSGGGAIWCLRAAPVSNATTAQLAAACGDGSIKLFSITARMPGAEYVRSLPRVEGNVLCLAWHPSGARLVSGGSDGCIHSWDVRQGTELHRITAGTSSVSPPCVWALEVLADGTIVSGDQEGAVQWWDGGFGALLARQQQFAADVLALAASPDGSCVWATGVDPRVVMFQLVPDKATGVRRWVYLDRKQPHTHDVRALGVLQRPDSHPLLLSGGNDGQLVLYHLGRFLKEHPSRQSRAPQAPLLQLSAGGGAPLLLHAQGRQLQLWRLGRAAGAPLAGDSAGGPPCEGDHWDLSELPHQLAAITTGSRHHIAAAALSPDGSVIAAADRERLRLLRLVQQQDADGGGDGDGSAEGALLQVVRVKVQKSSVGGPVVACAFSADSSRLFAVTGGGRLLDVDAASGEVTASVELDLSSSSGGGSSARAAKGGRAPEEQAAAAATAGGAWCASLSPFMPAASCLAVSPDGGCVAIAGASGVALLSTAPRLAPRARLALLGEPAAVTALAFSADGKQLAVATAANGLAAYDAASGAPTPWSLRSHGPLAELLQQLPGSISGLSFRPTPDAPGGLLVRSPGGLCHVDVGAPLSAARLPEKLPRTKQGSAASPAAEVGRNGRLLPLQHCCLLLAHLGPGEALLLEKPWADVLQQLVPPLYRHRYGT